MERKIIENAILVGERAAYASRNAAFLSCSFKDGESPLKESKAVDLTDCEFEWKYPLWYCRDVKVKGCRWQLMGRSGVWYTDNIVVEDSFIGAPKQFRRCRGVTVKNCEIPVAEETLWHCADVKLIGVRAVGDYFGMDCDGVYLENVTIDGNYCFDGASNIVAKNCVFNSKDAFWNCRNVTLENCTIVGEYLGWNTRNITFINCKIEAHQGLCYIDGLKLVGCEIKNSDLIFELCSDIDAVIVGKLESVKNPTSGVIACDTIDELIIDEDIVDPAKTLIKVRKNG